LRGSSTVAYLFLHARITEEKGERSNWKTLCRIPTADGDEPQGERKKRDKGKEGCQYCKIKTNIHNNKVVEGSFGSYGKTVELEGS